MGLVAPVLGLSVVMVSVYECHECGTKGLPSEQIGKFYDDECGVCKRCLAKMGVFFDAKSLRGTNRTPPKKRRKKR